MKTQIIIQVFLALLAAGAIAGIVKLPAKNKLIGVIVLIITLVASVLLWSVH